MTRPIDWKWKGSKLLGCWANDVTLSFDHKHGFDHKLSWLNFEIPIISGIGGVIDIQQKKLDSGIHDHGRDLLVTKVRCKDLPNNDWGEFKCRRAVDTFS